MSLRTLPQNPLAFSFCRESPARSLISFVLPAIHMGRFKIEGPQNMIRVRPMQHHAAIACKLYCLLHFESLITCKMHPKSATENNEFHLVSL